MKYIKRSFLILCVLYLSGEVTAQEWISSLRPLEWRKIEGLEYSQRLYLMESVISEKDFRNYLIFWIPKGDTTELFFLLESCRSENWQIQFLTHAYPNAFQDGSIAQLFHEKLRYFLDFDQQEIHEDAFKIAVLYNHFLLFLEANPSEKNETIRLECIREIINWHMWKDDSYLWPDFLDSLELAEIADGDLVTVEEIVLSDELAIPLLALQNIHLPECVLEELMREFNAIPAISPRKAAMLILKKEKN